MRRKIIAMMAVVAAGIFASGPPGNARADALDTMFAAYVAKERLPGAVLLVSGPKGRRVLTAGIANRQTRAPVTPDTRFYVASVTKSLVAVMVLQQIDEGAYRLDSPAAPLVADLPGIGRLQGLDRVTVHQLLNHSSGLAEYLGDDFERAVAREPQHLWTAPEVLRFAYDQPAAFQPGRKYEYTNTNFVLLGHIVEAADQGPLARSFSRRIFQRAGMTASTIGAAAGDPTLAHGYSADGGRLEDVSLASWNEPLGDGAVVTTAADLERFVFAAFRDGKLLSPGALARMKTPSANEATYGLGLSLYGDGRGHCLYHNGSVDGFNAEFAYYVEQQTAIVFLTNGDGRDDHSVADDAVSQAADIVFADLPLNWAPAAAPPAATAVPAATAAAPISRPDDKAADNARQRSCVRYLLDTFEGGEEEGPVRGQSKAETWCRCYIDEEPADPGDLARYLRSRRGRSVEDKCDHRADWGVE